MARDHARIHCAIWQDEAFVALSSGAQSQWFYLVCHSGRVGDDATGLWELENVGLVRLHGEYVEFLDHRFIAKFPRSAKRRAPIPHWLRSAIFERDGAACGECGALDNLGLDHIFPWSRGGEDTYENLRVLCRSCNTRKGAKV
jgi:hypothetical protein